MLSLQAIRPWWGSLSAPSFSSLLRPLVLIGLISLAGCSGGLNPLSLLSGGGPNVAANTQLGQENNQTLGTSETINKTFKVDKAEKVEVTELDQSSGDTQVEAKEIDSVTVENGLPLWLLWLLIPNFIIWYVLLRLPPPERMFPNSWFFGHREDPDRIEPKL